MMRRNSNAPHTVARARATGAHHRRIDSHARPAPEAMWGWAGPEPNALTLRAARLIKVG